MWRTLAICDRWPWPVRSGGEHRLSAMLEALNQLGDLTICILPLIAQDRSVRARTATSAMLPAAEVAEVPIALRSPAWPAYLWSSRWPWWDPWRTVDFRAIRDSIQAAVGREPFDVLWAYSTLGGTLLNGWGARVRVLDLPELLDVMHQQRRALHSPQGQLGSLKPRYLAGIEARAWRRVQKRACAEASLVTVCSEFDRRMLRCKDRVAVVPNGYHVPVEPAGRVDRDGPGTFVLQGTMDHFPNSDAAEFFGRDVLPLIRARVEDAQFRVVGRSGPTVEKLSVREGVHVVGSVDRIEDELAKADVVVVPLRIGSGSRLKILEAWAHGLPVVTTTIGAAGLPVSEGENALLANSATALAEACVRALTDRGLRTRLARGGRRTVESTFNWGDIQAGLIAIIRDELEAQQSVH